MITSELQGDYRTMARELSNFSRKVRGPLLTKMGQLVVKQTKRRIRKEKRSPDGVSWAPRKDTKPHPLMTDTRELLRSIHKTRKEKDLVDVSSGIGYDVFHQGGTRKMEARPIWGLSSENIEEIDKAISTWVKNESRRTA